MALTPTVSAPTSSGSPGARVGPVLAAVVVACAAFAWLNYVLPPFLVTDDGVRDQLLARDCTEFGYCHRIGPRTSLPELHQGAVWIDLLVAVRLAGGDTASARNVVLGLLGLSAATVFIVFWRWVRPSIALPAAVLLTAGLGLDRYPTLLINPSPAVFTDVLTAAGLLAYGLGGELRFLVLGGFALGVGINTHVGSLSLVPPLIALAIVAGARPWRDLAAAALLILATCLLTSSAALLANCHAALNDPRLPATIAAGGAWTIAARCLRNRFRRLAWDARAWCIGWILALPFFAALVWLLAWRKHGFGFSYLHPVLGPAAGLGAALLAAPWEIAGRRREALRWIPSIAASIAIVVAVHPRLMRHSRDSELWTIADAAVIAEHAANLGWSYEDLVFHVQGRSCRELLVAMSAAAPAPSPRRQPAGRNRQVQVLTIASQQLPAIGDGAKVVRLSRDRAALVREIPSWLESESTLACQRRVGAELAPACASATEVAPTPRRETFLFALRPFPEIHALETARPYVATYEIPLVVRPGERREIALAERTIPGCVGWRITRVEGVEFEDRLPAERVRLDAREAARGRIVLEREFGADVCAGDLDRRYPPCLLESEPGDALAAAAEGD